MSERSRVLILGASGRLGNILVRHWSDSRLAPVWQFRAPPARPPQLGEVVIFDPLEAIPDLGRFDIIIGLAGIVPGRGDLALNTELARAALACAANSGARHVMLSSSAAVYGASSRPLHEDAALRPTSAYGEAKRIMEEHALAEAAAKGIAATALRIGNVAGADALLEPAGTERVLDHFEDGTGPVRSYIGPKGFCDILCALAWKAYDGAPLARHLNLALRGGVAMEDLCHAAGFSITWRPAPATALPRVVMDVSRLESLVQVAKADAGSIVAEWQQDKAMQ